MGRFEGATSTMRLLTCAALAIVVARSTSHILDGRAAAFNGGRSVRSRGVRRSAAGRRAPARPAATSASPPAVATSASPPSLPSVSVMIVTYDRLEFLSRALAMVAAQDYPPELLEVQRL